MKKIVLNKKQFKHIKSALGYIQTSELNLQISHEDYHLEQEGARLYEMDSKETKSKA